MYGDYRERKTLGTCLGVIIILVVSWLITGVIILGLWNFIISPVFDVRAISFWQACIGGIVLVISKNLLFGTSSK